MPEVYPVIPETITVHLGAPDSPAADLTLPFPDYIRNVASGEIYPTWPESALRANIYAQVTFALNRVYTEYYRARGYAFDITSSTAYDQSFVPGRDIFENVSRLVDELFNDYLRRHGNIEPLFSQYCDGRRVTCRGLSQWGTVDLALQGLPPYPILQRYYGQDLEIVYDAPVGDISTSLPPAPLTLGSAGNAVQAVQIRLNRVSVNYPAIPKIPAPDGLFGEETAEAVRAFQRVFDLSPDGIVGKATWYRLQYVYDGIKRLNELDSEGLRPEDLPTRFPDVLREGDSGAFVGYVQYFLSYLSRYEPTLPDIAVDGIFGTLTEGAVEAFQRLYSLPVTGVIDGQTYDALLGAYRAILETVPPSPGQARPYPGTLLVRGSRGEDVRLLQTYLERISRILPSIPPLIPDGIFGERTQNAVRLFQEARGIPPSGVVGSVTWAEAASLYDDLTAGEEENPPGRPLAE